ncbi:MULTISPECIES: hypothetical protein [unclassified Microcoleus]|uniref:hypothetical protein n=1 Tax=unclassified Microcoleus TaxID=2642155 RepID=UPI002FD4BEEE
MHPYEWGILLIKALDFYPIFDCADCSHCSCCCGDFCGGDRRRQLSQQPMWWRLSARQNLPGSSGVPIVAPFFYFFVLTRNEPGDRLDAVTRSPASRLICSRLAPSIEAVTKKN